VEEFDLKADLFQGVGNVHNAERGVNVSMIAVVD
jgi:hypothetical protein